MNLKTSEVLDLAADKIQQHGWTQGHTGWPGPVNLGPLCLEGALMAALGLDRDIFMEQGSGITATLEFINCPAYQAVSSYLADRRDEPRESIFWWNDEDGRTAAEVIEVLRGVAAVERVREATLGYDTEDQPLPIEVAA